MTPEVAQRSCAIIARAELNNNILENSFQQRGRACKLDVFWEASIVALLVRTFGQNRVQHNIQIHFQTSNIY